jgi:hypothetical protein
MMFRIVFWDVLPCKMIVESEYHTGLLFTVETSLLFLLMTIPHRWQYHTLGALFSTTVICYE